MNHDGRAPIDIARAATGQALILSITGDIDVATIPRVDAALRAAVVPVPSHRLVVVDLSPVESISAAGVRLLKNVADSCADRGIRLHLVVGPGSIVRRIITITDLDRDVPTFGSLDQALRGDKT